MPIHLSQPLQTKQRPSSDLASMAKGQRDLSHAVTLLQRQIDYLFSTIGSPPTIDFFSVEAAEIGTLYVGNIDGAGQVEIYSGPPSYDLVGFLGTRDSGQVMTVTSITGGTVVIAGTHSLSAGNIVLISGTSNAAHNDYFIVASIIDESTFTITVSGNSTGGEAVRQFRGGWLQEFAHGGVDPETAPVYSNAFGQTFFGGEASITLLGPQAQSIGFFGTDYDLPGVAVFGATNTTPIVITTDLNHNMVDGDTAYIFGVGGNLAANGLFIIHNPTPTTFEIHDLDDVAVAGSGAFTTGGSVWPYDSGILTQTIAIGQSFDNYKLRAFADGSLKIIDALIELTGPTSTITLDPEFGELSIEGAVSRARMFEGLITIQELADPTNYSVLTPDGLQIADSVNGTVITIPSGTGGIDSMFGYKVGGVSVIDSNRDIACDDISCDDIVCDDIICGDLNVGGTLTISGSFDAGGVDATPQTITNISHTTVNLQYKDHAGVNQTQTVVTSVVATTINLWTIDGGIVTGLL